jgi:carboxymethylenebutenolidase
MVVFYILIQRGVEDGILKKSKSFADKGFMVIVPDLYRGKVADDREEANHLMSGLGFFLF